MSKLATIHHPPPNIEPRPSAVRPDIMSGGASSELADVPSPRVRVAIGISRKAAGQVTGSLDLFAQALVDSANQTFLRSDVDGQLVLAGIKEFDYSETGFHEDLNALIAPNDRVLDDVHKWRAEVNGQIFVLLTTSMGTMYCGIARVYASVTTAFAVVSHSCALGNLSFAHEIGHLFGANHNPEANDSVPPFNTYGHGRILPSFRTVMAYANGEGCNCPRENVWAGPTIKFRGHTTGTANIHHDARVLREMFPVFSTFAVQ